MNTAIPMKEISDTDPMTPLHYSAIRSDGLTFMQCLEASAGSIELVQQFDRLYGATIASRKSPIEKMIDDATGKTKDDMAQFCRFVWNCIFIRCAPITAK